MDPVLAGQILAGLFFLAILGTLMFGYLVAFALGGLSILFAVLGWMVGAFDMHLLSSLATRFFGVITNPVLIAVPLFVFMGVVLEKSRIAEVLLTTMGQLFGTLRGGLGFSVVIVGTLLAASTGVVGATVVTMGLLSLPAMMRAGYDPRIATGVICAAGTLGQIIPPSTVLIFVADILQGANAAAQMELGNFAPDTISVGDLFAGAFIPGLALAFIYGLYIAFRAFMDPASCPALPMTAEERSGLWRRAVVALVPPMTLIIAVLGSIIAGVATPTESASVGSLGAIFLMIVKMLADHHLDDGSGNSATMEAADELLAGLSGGADCRGGGGGGLWPADAAFGVGDPWQHRGADDRGLARPLWRDHPRDQQVDDGDHLDDLCHPAGGHGLCAGVHPDGWR